MNERSVAVPPARPAPLPERVTPADGPATGAGGSSRLPRPDRALSWRRSLRAAEPGEWLASRWLPVVAGAVLALYLLIFIRGLGWQWGAVLSGTRAVPPVIVQRAPAPAAGRAPAPAGNAPAAPAPPGTTGKVPLPPSNEPPPRDATDERGVTYDAQGVAVMGIDADPSGVYNVPPGRQVRIGGPAGQLFDVLPGGRIAPATKVKVWPS